MQQRRIPDGVALRTADGDRCAFIVYTDPTLTADVRCFFSTRRCDVSSTHPNIAAAFAARRLAGVRPLTIIDGEPLRLVVSTRGLPDFEVELPAQGTGTWREIGPAGVAGVADGAWARTSPCVTASPAPHSGPAAA